MSRSRFAAWSLALVLLIGLVVLLAGALAVEDSDFFDFYLAAVDIMQANNVYGLQENGLQGFFNPIWAAIVFTPLTAFTPALAFHVWRILLLLLLAGAAAPLFRLYDVEFGPGWLAIAGWLFLLPWFVGQNAPLVAAGAFAALVFGQRERWELSGAMMPLLLIKPHTVPLLPLVLLAAGRVRFVIGAVASGLLALVAGILVQPNWLVAWLTSRWGQSQAGAGQQWPASGLLNALDYASLPVALLYAIAVAGALLILWWQRDTSLVHRSALALGLGTAIAPYVRAGDFPLLLPALLLLPANWARVTALVAALIFFVPGTPVPLLWLIPGIISSALVLFLMRQ